MTSDRHGKEMGSQVRRLAKNAMALVAGGIVAQLVMTLLEVLIARKLGAEAYGIFVTAYAWTVLGSILMGLGTAMWTIQEGSRDQGRIPLLLGSGLSISAVVFVGLYLLLCLVVWTVAPDPILTFLLILLPYGLILCLQTNLASVFSCYQTMQVNALFQGIAPVGILAVYFVFSASDLSLEDVGLAYVIGGGIVTGAWLVYTLRKVRPRVSAASIRDVLRSSNQYALSNVLGHIYYRVDIIMLSALAGIREAGIYAAAFKLVELVFKVAVVAGRVFAPAIFKASHEPGKSFQVFASMMTRFMAIAGLVAGVATFILAEEIILLLFGETYLASASVLRILGGVMVTRCMMVALQLLLSSIDLHSRRVACMAVTVVAHIAINAALIPRLGAVGAAWAALASGALLILLYALSASKQREFRFLRWLLMPSCLAVAIAVTVSVPPFLLDVNVVLRAAISISVFLAGLLALGFVRPDEIRFVLRSVLPNGSR